MSVVIPQRFGWVGLGAMGYPMANQLLKNSSSKLVIFDLDQSVLHRFVREAPSGRVEIASSTRQVADESVRKRPTGKHVKEVYLTAETGLLAANTPGKVFVDCSTIDLATSIAIGEAVSMSSDAENPARFYDCPVSGGTAGAVKGTITFMVGMAADDPGFPFIRSILSTMGGSINPMGRKGLGLAAKLCNNYLSGTIALATSEAMNLGMKLGIDPKVLSDCLDKGSAANWVNSTVNPGKCFSVFDLSLAIFYTCTVPGVCPDAVTSKSYEGGFKVQLMEKDLRLAVEAAQGVGAKLVLGDTTIQAYHSAASDLEYRDKDSRVVYKWLGGVDPRTNAGEH
ncbi:NAD binding domain of 6-phosphogluconate dehydrogenase-domain-containing protein [Mycena maculata]|uniref:NAD binding domain of 6-phosphogluconate dehydrogenase-domain-containing protein n=1 Tax=Mycena maculata TaxID=230809 RepID=A0AAD7MP93_9AGAR|nr:NAD binding domain of 6-phosphogluconate dehydrogenase-domain-containing protein [Mycena maculata]